MFPALSIKSPTPTKSNFQVIQEYKLQREQGRNQTPFIFPISSWKITNSFPLSFFPLLPLFPFSLNHSIYLPSFLFLFYFFTQLTRNLTMRKAKPRQSTSVFYMVTNDINDKRSHILHNCLGNATVAELCPESLLASGMRLQQALAVSYKLTPL